MMHGQSTNEMKTFLDICNQDGRMLQMKYPGYNSVVSLLNTAVVGHTFSCCIDLVQLLIVVKPCSLGVIFFIKNSSWRREEEW